MSTVKRYKYISDGVEKAFVPVDYSEGDAPIGEYITYSHYANMVDQRDAAMMVAESGNALVKQLKDQLAEAKAENERLRKAGDAMAAIIRPPAHGPGEWDGEYDAWFAAKGVQS